MNVYEETQLILHKYKIQANKSLGQNFLIDDNVIDEIIRNSNIDKKDLIITHEKLLELENNEDLKQIECCKKLIMLLQLS